MSRVRRAQLGAIASAFIAVGAMVVPTGTATAHRAVPECTNADLKASYHSEGGGLGHRFGRIVLRNRSDHRCKTGGYDGLSYVAGASGFQVGHAAVRDAGVPVRTIYLRPGQKAKSQISETVAANYPRHTCQPHHVRGFRVYVPNSTLAQYIPHPTTGCMNRHVHLISHKAYQKVRS
jgi:Domain of unknown function (DUF4232)